MARVESGLKYVLETLRGNATSLMMLMYLIPIPYEEFLSNTEDVRVFPELNYSL